MLSSWCVSLPASTATQLTNACKAASGGNFAIPRCCSSCSSVTRAAALFYVSMYRGTLEGDFLAGWSLQSPLLKLQRPI